MKKIILFLLCLVLFSHNKAFSSAFENELTNKDFNLSVYKDVTNKVTIKQVLTKEFKPVKTNIFNYGVDHSIFWIKLTSKRDLSYLNHVIFIDQSRLEMTEMYLEKQ